MFAVKIEHQIGLDFWQSPDPNVIASSIPERWSLSEAKAFVDQHRSEKQPFAVYLIRGWYHKKVYPRS